MAARKKKTTASKKSPARGRKNSKSSFPSREAGGVLLMGLAVFVGLSLFSWQEPTPGILGIGEELGENLAGPAGAVAAGALLGLLGWGAWVLPPLLLLIATRLFKKAPAPLGAGPVIGIPLLIVLSAPLLAMASLPMPRPLPAGPGGELGLLGAALLEENVGIWGGLALLIPAWLAAFLMTTGLSLSSLFARSETTPSKPAAPPKAKPEPEPEPAPQEEAAVEPEPEPDPEPEPEPAVTNQPPRPAQVIPDIELPPLTLLKEAPPADETSEEALQAEARRLEEALAAYGVKATVSGMTAGPVVTTFELDPPPGLKASKVTGLAGDLAREMGAAAIRVVENVPGKNAIGIEVPNQEQATVYLRQVLESPDFKQNEKTLTAALGVDIQGAPVGADLAKMPHLLVAGTTGSGKSVAMNAMICSLLLRRQPSETQFLMVDPKMLELSGYDGIPHLRAPVVTDMKKAAGLLAWAVAEMEERYRFMAEAGVKNLADFNARIDGLKEKGLTRAVIEVDPATGGPVGSAADRPRALLGKEPYIVVVVDELADLMIQAGDEVEPLLARLGQMARAAGLHLVLATQRPSVDVLTGVIKANFPTRLAFQVSSKVDSRTILDGQGAESLLGRGDGLYRPPGTATLRRIHAPFLSDDEIAGIVGRLRKAG